MIPKRKRAVPALCEPLCQTDLLLRRLNVAELYPAEFFICKAEEGGVAVATPTDDNVSRWEIMRIETAAFNCRSNIIGAEFFLPPVA